MSLDFISMFFTWSQYFSNINKLMHLIYRLPFKVYEIRNNSKMNTKKGKIRDDSSDGNEWIISYYIGTITNKKIDLELIGKFIPRPSGKQWV